jgi:hypothetical protein
MKIQVVNDDGTIVDVTEGVQVCYDLLVASLDWGSGFLSTEESKQVLDLARAAGFAHPSYDGTGKRI